jgi:hypothetical protein
MLNLDPTSRGLPTTKGRDLTSVFFFHPTLT